MAQLSIRSPRLAQIFGHVGVWRERSAKRFLAPAQCVLTWLEVFGPSQTLEPKTHQCSTIVSIFACHFLFGASCCLGSVEVIPNGRAITFIKPSQPNKQCQWVIVEVFAALKDWPRNKELGEQEMSWSRCYYLLLSILCVRLQSNLVYSVITD